MLIINAENGNTVDAVITKIFISLNKRLQFLKLREKLFVKYLCCVTWIKKIKLCEIFNAKDINAV
jgi:hypothetical protein